MQVSTNESFPCNVVSENPKFIILRHFKNIWPAIARTYYKNKFYGRLGKLICFRGNSRKVVLFETKKLHFVLHHRLSLTSEAFKLPMLCRIILLFSKQLESKVWWATPFSENLLKQNIGLDDEYNYYSNWHLQLFIPLKYSCHI